MNLILILRELWNRRLLVVLAGVGAAAIAAVLVYNVSFSPPSLEKRDHAEGHGSIEILVDSERSPIADVGRNLEPLIARAGVFSRYIAGGNVILGIAKQTGIPFNQIEVAGPAPLPGEATGITAAPSNLLPYGIEIVQRDALPIVDVQTRAPTVREARELAAATPGAVRAIVDGIQRRQQVRVGKRVTFGVLGPAQADLATEALGAKAAIGIFIALFALGILLILGIPRLVGAWRSVDVDPPGDDQVGVFPPVRPALSEKSAGARHAISSGEAIAERAQLKMRRGSDG